MKFIVRTERVYEYVVEADDENEASDKFIDGDYKKVREYTVDFKIEEMEE